MGRPGKPLLNWKQLREGDEVKVYTSGCWKKATVLRINDNSCLISYGNDSSIRATTVYDTRNVRLG
jgi:hypothetical protein